MSEVSLVILGGGPAGITGALQARELGAQVTLLDSAQVGGTSFNRGPAPVRTQSRAATTGTVTTGTVVDAVFFAVGWPANLSELNLQAVGVRTGRHAIAVDDYLRTHIEHIFAAGDVNGRSLTAGPRASGGQE